MAVLAAFLGAVHRRVGAAKEPLGFRPAGLAGTAENYAGTGRRKDLASVQVEGGVQLPRQPLGGGDRVGEAPDLLQQDDELVPPEAGYRVSGPRATAQAPGDLDQQLVAGPMAQRVVDVLEVVQVGEEHRNLAGSIVGFFPPPGALERRSQALQEEGAVGQAGEGVVVGSVSVLDRVDERLQPPRFSPAPGLGRLVQEGPRGDNFAGHALFDVGDQPRGMKLLVIEDVVALWLLALLQVPQLVPGGVREERGAVGREDVYGERGLLDYGPVTDLRGEQLLVCPPGTLGRFLSEVLYHVPIVVDLQGKRLRKRARRPPTLASSRMRALVPSPPFMPGTRLYSIFAATAVSSYEKTHKVCNRVARPGHVQA